MARPGLIAYLRDMGGKATHQTTKDPTMTQPIYRVQGVYASGRYVSHLVAADDDIRAIHNAQAIDNRIIRAVARLVDLDEE
jgi:hypothetical protein